ncbi:transcriptional regulator GutM [Bacillus mesophilum]|uniref:Uncharacterized protein n=1 Tax=Bacillus mesophilum TaxID=1071718 RepID=A0A7V7RHY5_9BACI|nr:transcriptional regulator GutM [Bacillus mesophilum]KAB2329289.1 hypothetical protein F7732_21525 [Bacillus mesophilum]
MKELLIIVVFIAVMQFITSMIHIKYYQSTVRKLGKEYSEGYLGVGMNQRKFKGGQVCIIVANKDGEISEFRILSGLTIFSMFKKDQHFVGESIHQINWSGKEKYQEVATNAIKMIKKEMQKKLDMNTASVI